MLRILFLLQLLVFSVLSFGQRYGAPGQVALRHQAAKARGERFLPVSLFQPEPRTPATDALWSAACERADVLRLVPAKAEGLIATGSGFITLELPTTEGDLLLDLERVRITAPDFRLVVSDGRVMDTPAAAHFQGVVRGIPGSLAAVSVFQGQVMGMISTPEGTWNLGVPDVGPEHLHVLYRDDRLRGRFPYGCFTPDDSDPYTPEDLTLQPGERTMRCVRLYWEGAYAITQQKGSVANATSYLTGLFNQHAILFANDGIDVVLQELFVWNEPSPYNATTASGRLNQFGQVRTSFNGDLAHLLDYGGMGGVAWLNTLCSSTNLRMAYSGINSSYQNVPTYSWSVMVVSHEEGHNMGSRHTHACAWNGNNTAIDGCGPAAGYSEGSCPQGPLPPSNVGGTIMSYCHLTSSTIKFQQGFGPQPTAVMVNRVNTATCLQSCGTTCDAPVPLSTQGVIPTSANLAWANYGALSYTLQWRPTTSGTWNTVSGLTTTTYALSGLSPETEYEFRVLSVCASGNSAYSAPFVFTTPLPCVDPYEPNNTLAAAFQLVVPIQINGLIAPQGDVDFYRFTLFSAGTLSISLFNLPADYDIQLLDNTGAQLAISQNGGTSPEWISGSASAGTYHVRVYGWAGANNPVVCYTLSIGVSAPSSCIPPGDVGSTDISYDSALLLWQVVPNVSGYDMRWKPSTAQTWTTVGGLLEPLYALNGLSPETSYDVQVRALCPGAQQGGSAWSAIYTFTTLAAPCEIVPFTVVDLRVWLDGPFDTQQLLMHDSLRHQGVLPLIEPYSVMGHVVSGPSATTAEVLAATGPDAPVDWVLVELRQAGTPHAVLEARVGLLLRDGRVVGVNGTMPLGFCQPAGNYTIAVRHRNHLGCMTATAYALGQSATTVDLRSSATATWGTGARRERSGNMVLWAGNAIADDRVSYTGQNNDRDQVLITIGGVVPTAQVAGYHLSDVNLDGRVSYTGNANDRDRILDSIGGVVPTAQRIEQLP
jgi:hypothetical protein